ncbi:hypothetical protein QH494_27060 [Sphingomonas sp. AR_OL41]|uniref:hypothetical protein n=1 Tax=Sphingomonas sp. AR_OL41 TaxID=3042729 RepID=UPI00247FCAFB|nr:hypothetical protein [Sphingomonas sp. AR_OL41]MDH7975855.1 hypothetical protein [Sphingomonas sp. AR_OL41]
MFESEADLDRADWPLLRDGAVNLFWNPEILVEARRALSAIGYDVAEISCERGWESFAQQLSPLLNWEAQFGYAPWTGNLNALNEGLREYPFGPSRRSALILSGFHTLVGADKTASHGVLDLLESHARDHLLFGNTLIVLVQTKDNRFECPDIGGRRASWNHKEWFNKNRGL